MFSEQIGTQSRLRQGSEVDKQRDVKARRGFYAKVMTAPFLQLGVGPQLRAASYCRRSWSGNNFLAEISRTLTEPGGAQRFSRQAP